MVKDYLSYTCYNNNRKSIKLLDALKEDNYSTLTNFVRLVFSKYYNNKLNNIYNIYKYASIDINKELIPKLSKEFTQDNKDNNLDKLAFEVVSRHIKNEMDGKHLCGACALDTFMSCPKVQKFNMPFDIYTFLTGIVVLKPYNKDKKLYEYDDGILIPKDSINYNIINYKGNKMCIDEFRVLDCDRHKEIKEEHKNNDLYEDDNNENKEGARKIISSEKYIHNDDVKKENNDKPVARIKFIPAGRHNK